MAAKGSECKQGLEAIGRVTHSWQDFYAHAISSASLLTVYGTIGVGFSAWSFNVGGDPDIHPELWPSSYGTGLGIVPEIVGLAEHPFLEEPPDLWEAQFRKQAAEVYVTSQYSRLLQEWLKACPCWCKQFEP